MRPEANAPKGAARPAAVEPVRRRMVEAAAGYAMVILAMNWLLEPVREFSIHSGADPVLANLSWAVAILLTLTFAAGWIVRTFGVPRRLDLRVAVGLGAVVIFVAGDSLLSMLLFGLSLGELTAALRGPHGMVTTLMLAVAVALPAVRGRSNEV